MPCSPIPESFAASVDASCQREPLRSSAGRLRSRLRRRRSSSGACGSSSGTGDSRGSPRQIARSLPSPYGPLKSRAPGATHAAGVVIFGGASSAASGEIRRRWRRRYTRAFVAALLSHEERVAAAGCGRPQLPQVGERGVSALRSVATGRAGGSRYRRGSRQRSCPARAP